MKKEIMKRLEKLGYSDPVYGYILVAAGVVFLYISFYYFAHDLYEQFLPIPCMMLLGALQGRKTELKNKKMLILPGAMTAWFLIIWLKQGVDAERVYRIGLFFTIYLFAFPLASLLQDGEKKNALKIFAVAYLAGAAVLTAGTVLLILDWIPAYFSWAFCWDGTRLQAFWHPNMTACFLMIGTVFCVTFLSEVKTRWLKAGLFVLMAMMLGAMVLTNGRTTLVVTGGYLAVTLFFMIIKSRKKWLILGVVAVILVAAVILAGTGYFEQDNMDAPKEKSAQIQTNSPQGTFINDLGTLNGRTKIWESSMEAIRDDRSILIWGVERPGQRVSPYNSFKITHLHNAWIETLVGMGVVGFLIAVVFTLIIAWNCLMTLLKHYEDAWKRNVALLALLLMAASCLEPYLFYTYTDYHPYNLLFFLCAGYLAHWQKADNG